MKTQIQLFLIGLGLYSDPITLSDLDSDTTYAYRTWIHIQPIYTLNNVIPQA